MSFSLLRTGDHVTVKGSIAGEDFYHHGIFVGDGIVDFGAGPNGKVRKVNIHEFTAGRRLERIIYQNGSCLDPSVVKENAEKYLQNPQSCGLYDIMKNNCEHFATKCKTGYARSKQLWNKLAECVANPIKGLKYAIGGALLGGLGGLSNVNGSNDLFGSSSLSGMSGSSALCGKGSY